MIVLAATMWPPAAERPTFALLITYDPPRRARRTAPPSLRASSLDANGVSRLAELIAAIPLTDELR